MSYTREGIFVADAAEVEKNSKLYASLGDNIIDLLDKHSHLVLLVDASSGREWTGAKLKTTILNIASALVDNFGIGRGDVACIKLTNSDLKFILCLAVACTGATTGFVFFKDQYAYLLQFAQKSEMRFLFCHHDQISMAEQLEGDSKKQVVAIAVDGNGSGMGLNHLENLMNYDYTKSRSFGKLPAKCEVVSEDVAYLISTSGTTGLPKLVPITHERYMNTTCDQFFSAKGESSAIFCSTSFEYISGIIISLISIRSGYKLIISHCLLPMTLLSLIERYKIQEMVLNPVILFPLTACKDNQNFDLSSLKHIVLTGGRINYPSELRQFVEKHPSIATLSVAYGTTEADAITFSHKKVEEYFDEDNSGKLVEGVQVKVVGQGTGKLLGPNERGLLRVKNQNLFPGYYDISRKNDSAGTYMRDSTIFDEDGFYITGDYGFVDENGRLTCLGRESELMICRTIKKTLPIELETVLAEHPAICTVCVLGICHKINPVIHCPRAFIVPEARYHDANKDNLPTQPLNFEPEESLEFTGINTTCSLSTEERHRLARDIMGFFVKRISWQKHLTGGIVLLDTMPALKTSGKLDKNYLRSLTPEQVEIYGDRTSGAM